MSKQKIYLIGYKECDYWFSGRRFKLSYEAPVTFHKIGIATHPQERLNNMSPATPHKLELITVIETDDAETTEQLLHSYYSHYRVNGEWFKLVSNAINSLEALDYINSEVMRSVRTKKKLNELDRQKSLYVNLHDQSDSIANSTSSEVSV